MEKTFVLIKPNAMEKSGAILKRFQDEDLSLVGLKIMHVQKSLCEKFYEEHKERAFFLELVNFITSAPVLVLALKGNQAVLRVREIMGDTDPANAKHGTLRQVYGDSIGKNAVHGSDSLKSANRELDLFFSPEEIF